MKVEEFIVARGNVFGYQDAGRINTAAAQVGDDNFLKSTVLEPSRWLITLFIFDAVKMGSVRVWNSRFIDRISELKGWACKGKISTVYAPCDASTWLEVMSVVEVAEILPSSTMIFIRESALGDHLPMKITTTTCARAGVIGLAFCEDINDVPLYQSLL